MKCPNCNKETLKYISTHKNYPHGRKSRPIYTIKKIKYKCKNCGWKKIMRA